MRTVGITMTFSLRWFTVNTFLLSLLCQYIKSREHLGRKLFKKQQICGVATEEQPALCRFTFAVDQNMNM